MWVMYELNHFMFYLSIHLTSIFVSYVFIRNHKIQPLAMGMLPHVIPLYTMHKLSLQIFRLRLFSLALALTLYLTHILTYQLD